ncbi:MAG: ribonuclease [Thermoleophilaceae bacterium]|nr:ribonuclease [Thermoleophilaceae bacterium]
MSATARAAPRGRLDEPRVAVLSKRGRFLVAEPVFERGRQLTLDGGGSRRAAGAGDLVLLGWGKRGPRVARSLGRPDVARDVLEALMIDRGLHRAFPRAVESEAEAVAGAPAADERPRRDLTDLPTFTIDPASARDYDDAISATREGEGTTRVWVHIADVSAYVRRGTPLERETLRRATSVYVPGAVEPMLPLALSSGACSLVAGQERLAVTVELVMHGAETRSVAFHRSRIRSDAYLTYDQVDRIFAGQERAEDPWAQPLAAARGVAAALRERRDKRGSLAIESAEPEFEFDARGHVVAVHHEEQTESHRMIEELMILANERVADYLAGRQVPTLYRVHERPQPQAVERLIDQLASLEVPTPPVPPQMSPQQASEIVAEASRLVAEHVRRTGRGRFALGSLVLRSLRQAYYSPRNVGHAGLASPRYCHFTSPIRRFPDLVAHRALLASLGLDDAAPRADELPEAAEHSSGAEREAMKIERDADDVCLCFLLERRLHEDGWEAAFDGEVVGVISSGAFVRFGDEGYEGFLPVRRIRGDWYQLNEEETALIGESSGHALRYGDAVRVQVGRVEPARGRADLQLAPD